MYYFSYGIWITQMVTTIYNVSAFDELCVYVISRPNQIGIFETHQTTKVLIYYDVRVNYHFLTPV